MISSQILLMLGIGSLIGRNWTSKSSMNTARNSLAGAGLSTSALSFGGNTNGNNGIVPSAVTELFS